ncbi:MAG: slipin family protein [Elusimicrobia bacterium]|nr:slipin family protein [Elusimicrobiota bacterium]
MGLHPFTIGLFAALAAGGVAFSVILQQPWVAAAGIALGFLGLLSIRIAQEWQRAVILRLGRFDRLKGPGFLVVVPFVETVPYWIDLRTITTPFTAEQTLTKDGVSVDVDAVLFWRVVDPKKAALEVENYRQAIAWSAQTALRDIIGETDLAEMLTGRQKIDNRLQEMIGQRTEPWGIKALSVEIRDVKIPVALQNVMSMQAQAERERQARVILGDSEVQVANKFHEAALSYTKNPVALHLRALNILLEGMKQNSTVVIVPSNAVETMGGVGAMAGVTSLAKEFAVPRLQEAAPRPEMKRPESS